MIPYQKKMPKKRTIEKPKKIKKNLNNRSRYV